MTNIPELSEEDFGRAIKSTQRRRLMKGQIESGDDIVALRRFVGLTQQAFANALEISVHTLRNWEQGWRTPEGPALALLKIAARQSAYYRPRHRNLDSTRQTLTVTDSGSIGSNELRCRQRARRCERDSREPRGEKSANGRATPAYPRSWQARQLQRLSSARDRLSDRSNREADLESEP